MFEGGGGVCKGSMKGEFATSNFLRRDFIEQSKTSIQG